MSGPFKVIWRRRLIEKELAEYVVSAIERGESLTAITKAMNEIDQLLRSNPTERGESRNEFERVLIVPPLSVLYEVHEEEHLVSILGVRIHGAGK